MATFSQNQVQQLYVVSANSSTAITSGSAVGTVKLRDLALERARRANFQADQIIAKYAMGHGGLRPEAAGAVVFKVK